MRGKKIAKSCSPQCEHELIALDLWKHVHHIIVHHAVLLKVEERYDIVTIGVDDGDHVNAILLAKLSDNVSEELAE